MCVERDGEKKEAQTRHGRKRRRTNDKNRNELNGIWTMLQWCPLSNKSRTCYSKFRHNTVNDVQLFTMDSMSLRTCLVRTIFSRFLARAAANFLSAARCSC